MQIGLVESRPDRRANRARKGHADRAGVAPDAERRGGRVRRRRRGEAGRQGALRHLQGAGVRRRHRRVEGEGVRGRHPPPPLRRRRGDARLDVPPGAGIDRRVGVSLARDEGEPLVRPPRRPAGDGEEPPRRARRRREEPDLSARPRAGRAALARQDRARKRQRSPSNDNGKAFRRELEEGRGRRGRPAGRRVRVPLPPPPRVGSREGLSRRPASRNPQDEDALRRSPARGASPSSRRGPGGPARAAAGRRSIATGAPRTGPCRARTPRRSPSARRRTR